MIASDNFSSVNGTSQVCSSLGETVLRNSKIMEELMSNLTLGSFFKLRVLSSEIRGMILSGSDGPENGSSNASGKNNSANGINYYRFFKREAFWAFSPHLMMQASTPFKNHISASTNPFV